jgi:exodeoxyribonuclease X
MSVPVIRCVDTETTGDPPKVDLIEIGWSDVHGGSYSGWKLGDPVYKSFLVNPGVPVDPESSGVNHIITEDLIGAITPPDAVNAMLDGCCPSGTVLCAHNAEYEKMVFGDRGFQWIDTWKVIVHLAPKARSYKLQVLRYLMDLDVDRKLAWPPHRAGPDAYICAAMVMRMLSKLTVEEMVDISKRPAFLPRLGFGEHAKLPINEVPSSYLDWILKKHSERGDGKGFDEHVLYTAKTELMNRQNERRRL